MPSAVLVAEPEPETRELLGRQLREDGFDVLGAARRSEALELAETARPDVVLLAELDLCLRLRRGEPGRTWDQERSGHRARCRIGPRRARASARARRRRRHRSPVRVRRAPRAHSRADPANGSSVRRARRRRRPRHRSADEASSRARRGGDALGEGVRARREARLAALQGLDEGRALARRMGFQGARSDSHVGIPRFPRPQEALRWSRAIGSS